MRPKRRGPPLRHLVTAASMAVIGVLAVTLPNDAERRREGTIDTFRSGPPASLPADTTAETIVASAAGVPTPSAPAPAGGTSTAVRTVSGPGIMPLPTTETPPQRVAPPERPKPAPAPIVSRRLGLVRMDDTAQFSVGDIRVRLPGVAVTGAEETCRDRTGTEWPCGRRALAGVRAVVRGRAVDCPLPDKVKRGDFVTDCLLAGADMAERLVASGWARALDREGALGEAERLAEAKGLGLHGAAVPIGVDPFPEPSDLPADTTTAPLGAVAGAPLGAGAGLGPKSPGAGR